MMGDKGQLLRGRFGSPDIHITIYLSAISTYYLTVESLSEMKSQPALASSSRTNYSY